MIRTWKWSTILGFTAFILTFWLSIYNNRWETALFRASIGFLIFFIWGYGIKFIMQSKMLSENYRPRLKNDPEEDPFLHDEETFQSISLESLHTSDPLDFDHK